MRFSLAALSIAAVLGIALLAAPAACDERTERATELFDQALELMDEDRHPEACPLLEEAYALAHGLGIQFQLATCYAATGRLTTAREHFLEVADLATRAGQRDRAALAHEKAAELTPRLSHIDIVAPAIDGVEVRVDGKPAKGRFPVDPGTHVVSVQAPEHEPWQGEVEVIGEGQVVIVEVPVLARIPEPAPAPRPVRPPADADSRGGWGAWHTSGLVIGIVGVAGLAAGVVLGAAAKSKDDDAGDRCAAPGGCDADAVALNEDARLLGDVGTGMFVGGAVLAAAGVALLVTGIVSESASARLEVGPTWVGVHARF